jgi:hypothetical protein
MNCLYLIKINSYSDCIDITEFIKNKPELSVYKVGITTNIQKRISQYKSILDDFEFINYFPAEHIDNREKYLLTFKK